MANSDVLSIQLYTLRSLGSVEHVLDAAAESGYRHVELLGAHLDEAETVRKLLDERGLKASSSHVALHQLRDRLDALPDAAGALDVTDLFMPAVPPEERDMAADGWRSLGGELGRLADDLHKSNIRLGYHNHHWELALKEGDKTALDLLFEGAGSSPLAWQADVAWLVRGDVEPLAWLERYADRLLSAHVKDMAKAGEGLDEDGWADVGDGVLDWRTYWQACRDLGARWMVVEHDKPKDPARTAKQSYDYLANLTF